jgi:hypothetical protein
MKAKLQEDRHEAVGPKDVWAMDFVHDQLAQGKVTRDHAVLALAIIREFPDDLRFFDVSVVTITARGWSLTTCC